MLLVVATCWRPPQSPAPVVEPYQDWQQSPIWWRDSTYGNYWRTRYVDSGVPRMPQDRFSVVGAIPPLLSGKNVTIAR